MHFPNAVAAIHNIYDKCHVLMENDVAQWGTREDWLIKATAADLQRTRELEEKLNAGAWADLGFGSSTSL